MYKSQSINFYLFPNYSCVLLLPTTYLSSLKDGYPEKITIKLIEIVIKSKLLLLAVIG